jgi:hypothetical protein
MAMRIMVRQRQHAFSPSWMLDAFFRVRIEQEGVLFGENAELYFWHACGLYSREPVVA